MKAWDDLNMNPYIVAESCLECLFHPDWHNPNSSIQREMVSLLDIPSLLFLTNVTRV